MIDQPEISWIASALTWLLSSGALAGDLDLERGLFDSVSEWMEVRSSSIDLDRSNRDGSATGKFSIFGESKTPLGDSPVDMSDEAIRRSLSELPLPIEAKLVKVGAFSSPPFTELVDVIYRLEISGRVIFDWQVGVTIRRGQGISGLDGRMPEISDECRETWKLKDIEVADARRIVREDLERLRSESVEPLLKHPRYLSVSDRFNKVAYAQPPCLVWNGGGGFWLYTIDAVTGAILKRQDGRIK